MNNYSDDLLNTEYPIHKKRGNNEVAFTKPKREFNGLLYKYFDQHLVFDVYLNDKGNIILELNDGSTILIHEK